MEDRFPLLLLHCFLLLGVDDQAPGIRSDF
jgi:hypothetical protein